MRKNNLYHYKCYDRQNENNIDRIISEKFNEYGYNFATNKKRVIDYDAISCKTDYKNVKNSFITKER